jgi:outer membrane immunogenic protein
MPYSFKGFAALAESDEHQTGRPGARFPAARVEKSEEVHMTPFWKFGASAVVLVFASTAASAADFGPPAPPETAAPYVAPAFSWAGPYIGVLGGYGWANFNDGAGTTGNGWLAGGYLGYNWQADPWVFGLEVDGMWSGIRGSGATNTDSLTYLSTVRGRLGYAVDNWLFYGTAGAAVAGGRTVAPGPTPATATHTGWVVGAGIEAALTESVTGRVEYNYVDLNTRAYANGVTASPNAHILKIGLGFKF